MNPERAGVIGLFAAVVLVVAAVLSVPGSRPPRATATVDPGTAAWRERFRYLAGGPVTGPAAFDAERRIYLTSHDGHLHFLAADGSFRFRRPLGEPDASTGALAPAWGGPLVLEDGRIAAGSDAGVLHVFDPQGTRLASLDLGAPIDRTPQRLPGGGLLVVAGSSVHALDAALGSRFRFDAREKVYAEPAIDAHGQVYVAARDDTLVGLDRRGHERFRFAARADLDASPVWSEGRVFVGSAAGRVYAVDADSGAELWSKSLDAPLTAPLALGAGGALLVPTLGPRPRVVALAPTDGATLWTYAADLLDNASRGFTAGLCTDAAGDAYVGGHDDQLHALTAKGELRSRFSTRGAVTGRPVLRPDGLLVVGTRSGLVYGLSMSE